MIRLKEYLYTYVDKFCNEDILVAVHLPVHNLIILPAYIRREWMQNKDKLGLLEYVSDRANE